MDQQSETERRVRQVSLIDLFAMIAFVMPTFTAVAEFKRLDGSAIGYVVIVPLMIVLGGVIVYAEWTVERAIWRRFEKHSRTVQNAIGTLLYGFSLLWILVGLISGQKLAVLVVNRLAR